MYRLGTYDKGVKFFDFYVIKHTPCPAVLVETELLCLNLKFKVENRLAWN